MAKSRELTPKQQLFVQEYLKDLNAAAAARRAGYAEANAVKYAHQLMQLEHVQQAITAAFAARSERTKIDADWVLNRLAEEAEADLADILGDDGAVKPVKDWPKIWRKGLVAGLDVEEIRNRDGEIEGHVRKIKLSDRIKRIELIGKHVNVQAFREKIDLSNPDGSLAPKVIDAASLSTEALKELMGAIDATPDTDAG